MTEESTPVLLVTANVGSVFEDPFAMLKVWTKEFLSTVSRLEPKFLALHCQEVGGKNYERSMKNVEYFVRLLMSSEELRLFDKVHVYLDEDFSSAENFTALGNLYFIHESITDVLVWDFSAKSFVEATGKKIHCGNIEAISSKEKSKFPQDFFPECKWSRKGFLRTRWNLNGTVFDLINIHLFHDASNFVAMESFPSVYCKSRRRALEHTLDRFHNDSNGIAPFFLFGDFNFRTDTQGVVQKLAEGLNPVRVQGTKNSDHSKLQYRNDDSEVVLSLGKKEFYHRDHQTVFFEDDAMWLKEFDHELEPFDGRLFEFPIFFPPSYPFEEDEKGAKHYMQTRCPSWCDRVILSSTAKSLVQDISDSNSVEYGIIGSDTCMGDHKPVYLKLDLTANAGTVKCCSLLAGDESSPLHYCRRYLPENAWPCTKSMTLDTDHLFIPDSRKPVTLYEGISINVDSENHLLLPTLHPFEPYTPESIDTPSLSPSLMHLDQFKDAVEERLNTYSSLQKARDYDDATCTCDDCDGKLSPCDKHSVTDPRKKISQCSLDVGASYPIFRWFMNSDEPKVVEKMLDIANNPEIIVHDSDGCNMIEHRYLGLSDNDSITDNPEVSVVAQCSFDKIAPVVSVESLSDSSMDSNGSATHHLELFRCHSDPLLHGQSLCSRPVKLGRLHATVSCGKERHLLPRNPTSDIFGMCSMSHVRCDRTARSSSLTNQVLVSHNLGEENISPGTASYFSRSLASLPQEEHSQKSLSYSSANFNFPNSKNCLSESVTYPDALGMIVPNNDDYCTKETYKCLEDNNMSQRKLGTKGDEEIECDNVPLKHFEEKTVITSLPSPEESDVIQMYNQNKHTRFSCCCVN